MDRVNPQTSGTPRDESNLWRTPSGAFGLLTRLFGPFNIDAAATAENKLCPIWFGPGSPFGEDALTAQWGGVPWQPNPGDPTSPILTVPADVFCNPPYGRGWIEQFVEKAHDEARIGRCAATLLVPATPDVAWFHRFVWDAERMAPYRGVRVYFFTSRIKFLRPDGTPGPGSPGVGSMAVHFAARLR